MLDIIFLFYNKYTHRIVPKHRQLMKQMQVKMREKEIIERLSNKRLNRIDRIQ